MRTARDLSVFILAAAVLLSCTTDRTRRGYLREAASVLDAPARPVVVIPGFGVTRLLDPVTDRYVWGTPRTTMHTSYADDLDLDASDRLVPQGFVGSRGPINTAWQLMEALRKYGRYTPDKDSYAFAYDWRRSARDNAVVLRHFIDKIKKDTGAPRVDIVTHSAGSIVAMTYVKLAGGADDVENLILIAPVQRGVVDAFRVLVRPERFMRRVFRAEMVATWPFVFELMPDARPFLIDETGNARDFDTWPEEMERGRRLRDELNAAPLPANIRLTVIAGDCVPTARRVLARRDGTYAFYPEELRPSEKALAATMFEPGDGTVPVSSATANANASLFCDGHQGIASDPSVHRALVRVLHGQL